MSKIKRLPVDKIKTMLYDDELLLIGEAIKLDYTNNAKKMINKYGDYVIKQLYINRTPIYKFIDVALNLISLGKWEKEKKKYHFDKLFHLSLNVVIEIDGKLKTILIEKNEVINISDEVTIFKDSEQMLVPNKIENLTIKSLLNNGLRAFGKEKFFLYDGFTNNCQFFIRMLLKASHLLTKNLEDFLFQDISSIIVDLPRYVGAFQRLVTDTYAYLKHLIGYGHDD